MADFIVLGSLLLIIGTAVVYIVNAKKSGVKCIGCPAGGNCSRNGADQCGCGCGCHSDTNGEG